MKAIKSYNQLSQEFMRYKEKETNQQEIEFLILDLKESYIYNYSKLTLLFNNEINDQFIIKPVYNINKASKIKIKFNDIIFRTFNGILYFEIKYISAITKDNPNIINKKYNNFNFSLHKYFNCLSDLKQINYNSLVSIPVKIKEKETFDTIPNIIFKDINKEPIIIQLDNEKLNVEGQKIYMLEGFLYNHKENKLYQLPNSNFTEIVELLDTNKSFEKSEIPNLFNFKGKIASFDFIRRVININIEYEGKNLKYEIEVISELFSKISLNCDCYFYNFYKTSESKYKYNYFSNIKYNQKTYITINFADEIKDKYYDSVKYDKIIKEINKKSITFELDDYSNKTSEIKTITYLKKDTNKNIIDQEDFHFEINTGKNNNVDSLSTKTDGYSYQLYFETNNKNTLPETYTIKDANKRDIIIKPEKNENEFYERFTILNVPFQNIKENYENKNLSNFSLNDKKDQEIKEKSFKYLFINNNIIKMHKFILKPQENSTIKIFYDQFKKYEDDLKIFFRIYFPKQMDSLQRDIKSIIKSEKNKNILNIFSNKALQEDFKIIIEKGFDEYYFDNCRRDYALIRNICFAFLCLKAKENDFNLMKYNQIFSTFKSILASLSMEYIDRIKAVIAITREFNYRYLYSNISGLCVVKLKTKNTKYSLYTNAMKTFLNIINGLTEICPLYKAIRQYSSIILNDELSNKNIYSGTILNIKDIQIELFKQAGQFCIIQEGIPNLYGSYWSCARTLFLNPDTIFGKYYERILFKDKEDTNGDENIVKRATACTLFVIFNEITEYLKTNINGSNNSHVQVYINDKEFKKPKLDLGYFLEYIMPSNIINCRNFMDSNISEQLLDEKLYLSDNFDELKKKLNQIKYSVSPMNEAIKTDKEKIDYINENYNKMTIDELFVFFSNLNEEQMNEMKDSKAYKFFLSFYDEKGKKF